jgi:hypothetical protein
MLNRLRTAFCGWQQQFQDVGRCQRRSDQEEQKEKEHNVIEGSGIHFAKMTLSSA